MRSKLAVVLLLALGCAGAVQAASPDPDLPKPGVNWRYITLNDTTTTSKCVGDPRTPLCAVETIRACFLRRDDRLCMKVRDEPAFEHIKPFANSVDIVGIRYRVLSATRVGPPDIPKRAKTGRYAWLAGDVSMKVDIRQCRRTLANCNDPEPVEQFDVRKVDGRWKVIDWGASAYQWLEKEP
jgi:hypothetical protein